MNYKKKLLIKVIGATLLTCASAAQAANWLMLQGTEPEGQSARAKVWGFIQAQYQNDNSDANAKGGYNPPKLIGPNLDDQSQFNVNRARIGVRGTGFPLDSKVNYFILAELGNNGITYGDDGKHLTDASITLNHIPGARVRMGQFKTPGAEEGLQAIRLPYGKGESSIYIFLPSEDSDLRAFHETLTEASLDKWIGAFESRKGSIEIPRFKTEYRSELRKSLSSLGMETAFSNLADFSRLCNAKPGEVRIDKVIHKTFIEINEEGTEAAAATSVGIVLTSTAFGPKPFHMIVDRPFFFVLRDDDSGMILFMGSVTNPS